MSLPRRTGPELFPTVSSRCAGEASPPHSGPVAAEPWNSFTCWAPATGWKLLSASRTTVPCHTQFPGMATSFLTASSEESPQQGGHSGFMRHKPSHVSRITSTQHLCCTLCGKLVKVLASHEERTPGGGDRGGPAGTTLRAEAQGLRHVAAFSSCLLGQLWKPRGVFLKRFGVLSCAVCGRVGNSSPRSHCFQVSPGSPATLRENTPASARVKRFLGAVLGLCFKLLHRRDQPNI